MMTSLSEFLKQDFDTTRDQWVAQLQRELKLQDVSLKTSKKLIEGGVWPTLSQSAPIETQLPVSQSWKKAAQSYAVIPTNIAEVLTEDLNHGVRSFFFDQFYLDQKMWNQIEKVFTSFSKKDELEVFLLGERKITTNLSVIDESMIANGRASESLGGGTIQELALMTKNLISNLKDTTQVNIGVFVDSQFFKNIAKIRAAKLLAIKVLEVSEIKAKVHIIALTSFREWTLFERYTNLLRNDVAVASSLIAGADSIQSSGYQIIFDLETNQLDNEHSERSRRMARNTSHILALESMLGVVDDAAFGSYHLENLSQYYAQEAWSLMQKASVEEILVASESVMKNRLQQINTRKIVLVGINDYPDVSEVLGVLPKPRFFRLARSFEVLRLKMATVEKKPRVHIALYGDYSSLSSRVNFIKNYFELLGLSVNDPSHNSHDLQTFMADLNSRTEDIIVLCASDDHYPELAPKVSGLKTSEKYLAGKAAIDGFTSIHAGQDIYAVLESLVNRWCRS